MRGGLDQVKAGLNSTLEAVQFLSRNHPPTSGAFILIYTAIVHDTVLFGRSPRRTSGGGKPPQRTSDSVTVPSSLLAMNPGKRLRQRTSRTQAPESQLHPRFRHGCSLFRVRLGLRPEVSDSISGVPVDASPPDHLPDNSERPQLTVPGTQLPLSASLFLNQTGLHSSRPWAATVPDSRRLPVPPSDPWLHQATSVLRPGQQD